MTAQILLILVLAATIIPVCIALPVLMVVGLFSLLDRA